MFTIEEISLMKIYSRLYPERKEILRSLKSIVDEIEQEDIEAILLTKSTIRKLTALNDDGFKKIDFTLANDPEDYE